MRFYKDAAPTALELSVPNAGAKGRAGSPLPAANATHASGFTPTARTE